MVKDENQIMRVMYIFLFAVSIYLVSFLISNQQQYVFCIFSLANQAPCFESLVKYSTCSQPNHTFLQAFVTLLLNKLS